MLSTRAAPAGSTARPNVALRGPGIFSAILAIGPGPHAAHRAERPVPPDRPIDARCGDGHPQCRGAGFPGLGAQPPDVECGAMLVDSIRFLFQGSWWVLLFPAFAIMITMIGFNLIGDGLRDSLDVRLRS